MSAPPSSAQRAMHVAVVGLSHKTAPLEERERIAIDAHCALEASQELLQVPGVNEAVVVSTCNRVELYVAGAHADVAAILRDHLQRREGIDRGWLDRYTYAHDATDAVRHLFRVTSSLDSLVLGEPQIVGQVKQAYEEARRSGCTSTYLNRVFAHAFKAAKRVRTETGIAENAVSVSYAAVELAKKVFGRLENRSVAVIGAGKMGGLAVKHFRQAGADRVHIVNRTRERARDLAEKLGGSAHGMDELPQLLQSCDILLSSTGSQDYIITHDLARAALNKRKYRPLFLIDIAVPRDIDPRCDRLNNVYLFDVDDLEKVVEANRAARQSEATRAESIVVEETDSLMRWAAQAEVVPVIVGLREKLNALRDAELERMRRAHPDMPPEAIEAAERMARALVNKVLHEPTVTLREASGSAHQGHMVAAVRSLFGLAEREAQESAATVTNATRSGTRPAHTS